MSEFIYDRMMDETYCVLKYEGCDKKVEIPPCGFNGVDAVSILYDRLFSGHSEIEEIIFPCTLTDIGEFVFEGCVNLKKVNLPENLRNMWPNAFARSGIEEIEIPDNVKTISPYVFRECKSLKRVVCGKELKKINGCAFYDCQSLEEIIVNSNTEISEDAFKNCRNEVKIIRR